MGLSQISPGFRNINVASTTHHPDADSVHRMLQQHLSEAAASTPYRSTLHNIQESETDESPDLHTTSTAAYGSPDEMASGLPCGGSAMTSSFTGVRHREGPMNASHEKSLFHSLYGQTGAYEPMSSELITADMCLSTLYLHELYHRQNRRRGIRSQTSQQHIWQTPHQQPHSDAGPSSVTVIPSSVAQSQMPAAQSPAQSRQEAAAEKTPLLYPKKT